MRDANFPVNKLTDSEYETCLQAAREQLRRNLPLRNQTLRALTGINYDQAIYFFNQAVAKGHLLRLGKSSGTRYMLPGGKSKEK